MELFCNDCKKHVPAADHFYTEAGELVCRECKLKYSGVRKESDPTEIKGPIDKLMSQATVKLQDDKQIMEFLTEHGVDPEKCEIDAETDDINERMSIHFRCFKPGKGGD